MTTEEHMASGHHQIQRGEARILWTRVAAGLSSGTDPTSEAGISTGFSIFLFDLLRRAFERPRKIFI
jgi:hypothetical protein